MSRAAGALLALLACLAGEQPALGAQTAPGERGSVSLMAQGAGRQPSGGTARHMQPGIRHPCRPHAPALAHTSMLEIRVLPLHTAGAAGAATGRSPLGTVTARMAPVKPIRAYPPSNSPTTAVAYGNAVTSRAKHPYATIP